MSNPRASGVSGARQALSLSQPQRERLSEAETWIFDLDNTLYDPAARLFDQIEARMTEFVSRTLWVDAVEARRVSEQYWEDHGATLTGLMSRDGLQSEPFLSYTHDIDVSGLELDQNLRRMIHALKGRKVVYTNGSRRHAQRVTEQIGLRDLFDAFYSIEDASFAPKPTERGFSRIVEMDGMNPNRAVMIEDDVRNLQFPKQLGMTTVWLRHDGDEAQSPDYVDIVTPELAGFLSHI